MNPNVPKMPSSSTPDLPVKRKRGRPRKDESAPRNEKRQTHTQTQVQMHLAPTAVSSAPQAAPPVAMTAIQPPALPPVMVNPVTNNNGNKIDPSMVGQVVTGVIDGVFDSGYLLSVRVGPNNNVLRGAVFQPGLACPITPANDVAPHLPMLRRAEFPVTLSNPRSQGFCTPQTACSKQPTQLPLSMPMQQYQATPPMVTGGSSTNSIPPENFRLVQQDEVMQVFEASKMDDCYPGVKKDHIVSDPTAENSPGNDVLSPGGRIHSQDMVSDESHQAATIVEASQGPMSDEMKQQGVGCDIPLVDQATDHETVLNETYTNEQPEKDLEGVNPEIAPPAETDLPGEQQPSSGGVELQQESEEQLGGVTKVDINLDPNQAAAIDSPHNNVPESEA